MQKTITILACGCIALAAWACSGDPNATMASPDQIGLAAQPIEISEGLTDFITLSGEVTTGTEGGYLVATATFTPKDQIPHEYIYLIFSLNIRKGGNLEDVGELYVAKVRGPVEAGTSFKASVRAPQSGKAGDRVLVLTDVSNTDPTM